MKYFLMFDLLYSFDLMYYFVHNYYCFDYLFDLRLMYPELFMDEEIIKMMDLQLFLEVYPEKSTDIFFRLMKFICSLYLFGGKTLIRKVILE